MVLNVAVRNPCALLVVGACVVCKGGVSKNVVLHFLQGITFFARCKKTNLIHCANTLHN